MGRVIQPTQKPEYATGKPNVVTGVAPAQLAAVAWVDTEGRKTMCLAIVFGRDVEDGGPGVYILADEEAMKTQMTIANSTVKKGVRAWLSSQKDTDAEDLPESLDVSDAGSPSGDLDIGAIDLAAPKTK